MIVLAQRFMHIPLSSPRLDDILFGKMFLGFQGMITRFSLRHDVHTVLGVLLLLAEHTPIISIHWLDDNMAWLAMYAL
jgi:hypothetical protein